MKKRSRQRPSAEPTEERSEVTSFEDLDLSDEMKRSLADAGYIEPTPIQAQLIPLALKGGDVLGQAQTGTGKTAAFAIPIFERFQPRSSKLGPQAIVLVPTRELAVQVRDEFIRLGANSPARVLAVYGGKPIRQQIERLRRGADIIVGTPGRLLDMMGRGALDLTHLEIVVLDEADRMLDIGFRPDIERILRQCPKQRQTLLLSATVPPTIKRLAQRYMSDPASVNVSPSDLTVDTIDQYYFTVEPRRKFDLLVKLLERETPTQAIVFCRTKRGTDRTFQRLSKKIEGVKAIHGDMAQGERDRVMRAFREGKVKILVATDVIGRGIDVSGSSHIVNYDIPQFSDDYVHRVGRTGRMGREGVAFTFVAPEEGPELTRIEQRINRQLKRDEIQGFAAREQQQEQQETDQAALAERPAPPASAMRRPRRRHRRAL